jgi:hypothetical protein
MEYSAIKNEIMPFGRNSWIEVEIIMVCEIILIEKDKYCMFSLM